jgi:hypothetical protein
MSSSSGDGLAPDLVAYVATLIEAERGGERATLQVGPFAAFLLIGVLQGATRGPNLTGYQREVLRGLARQLEPIFAGTPVEETIRQGYHPEFDVPPGGEPIGGGPVDSPVGP